MSHAKERYHATNTLASIVAHCVGHVTTVELRNESHVTGRVIQADGFMNVSMREVVFVDASGKKRQFDHFFVAARLIRYVQIPTVIDIRKTMLQTVGPSQKPDRSGVTRARQNILDKRKRRQEEDSVNAFVSSST